MKKNYWYFLKEEITLISIIAYILGMITGTIIAFCLCLIIEESAKDFIQFFNNCYPALVIYFIAIKSERAYSKWKKRNN